MANNFNGLFEGGAVAVNSLPYVQMYQQIKARNDAKQTAIDNYYRDLSKTLTPAGMAANDVEDFNGKVNQWRDFVTQNRQVLSNPRDPNYGKALNQAGYLYNDALGHADISKRKIAEADRYNQLRLSHPDYTITDKGMVEFDRAMQPISKGGGNLDWGAVAYNPKENPFTNEALNKYRESLGGIYKMSEGKPEIVVDPRTKSKVVTTKSFYTPKDVANMASDVHIKYNSEPQFKSYVDKLAENPDLYNEMNQKFKSIYGNEYDIKHGEEFAEMLSLPQTEKTNTQPYTFSPTNIKINIPKEDQITPSLDNYISQLQANAKPVNLHKNGKVVAENYLVEPDKNLSEAFAVKKGTQTLYPDQIQMQKDGSVLPLFYKTITDPKDPTRAIYARGSDGNYVIDEGLSLPVSNTQFRIKLAKELFGEKGVMNVMKSNTSQSQTQPKATEQKQTKTIKRSDIGTKATAAGYTAKEYEQLLIKNGIKIID